MEFQRINAYEDARFSKKVLYQHGCFLADDKPYEIEIISDSEAVVRGEDAAICPQVIEEFRFYTPHITIFYNTEQQVIKQYPAVQLLTIPLESIQVLPHDGRYISLDGHTRLYYAAMMGWNFVRAVAVPPEDYIFKFVEEAHNRGIFSPKDMTLLHHAAYETQWNGFCDSFFAEAAFHSEK